MPNEQSISPQRSMNDTQETIDTIVVSDVHLTQFERSSGMWRKYNQPAFAPDRPLAQCFRALIEAHPERTFEFVFNGDTFDFDQVTILPEHRQNTLVFHDILEKLKTTEAISTEKVRRMLHEHDALVRELALLVREGHAIVFIQGNHDIELQWPGVRSAVKEAFMKYALKGNNVPIEERQRMERRVRFIDWFYFKPKLFYIEHGSQYDFNTNIPHFLAPYLRGKKQIELNAGSIGSRIVTGRLGFFNPYLEEQFVLTGLGYVRHYMKYIRPHKKDFVKTWFIGSLIGIRVMARLPFALFSEVRHEHQERIREIAREYDIPKRRLRALLKLQPPTITRNLRMVVSALHIDKAVSIALLTLLLVILGAMNFFWNIRYISTAFDAIALFDIALLLWVMFVKTKPSTKNFPDIAERIARITNAPHIILGHLHRADTRKLRKGTAHYLNEGTWAPAFYDVECTKPLEHRHSFIWIHKGIAKMYEWNGQTWHKHEGETISEKK